MAAGGPTDRILVKVDRALEPIIPQFLEDTRLDARALSEALGREDYDRVWVLADATKGSAGGYGFHALSEICGRLAQAAKARDLAILPALAREFASYMDRIQIVFE